MRSGGITIPQRYQYARDAGFSPGDAVVMAAISLLECGDCEMSAINASGDASLWQINRVHWNSNSPSNSQYGDLSDPRVSAKAAYSVWKGAGGGQAGFKQWCTYPGGCGGASPITWTTFNTKIAQVTGAMGGITGPVPIPPEGISPIQGIDPQLPSQTPAQTTATSPPTGKSGTNAGQIGPWPINIPTGLIIGLIGVVLLIVGALLFTFQFKYQQPAVNVKSPTVNVRTPQYTIGKS